MAPGGVTGASALALRRLLTVGVVFAGALPLLGAAARGEAGQGDRYACVAASCALVSRYYGKDCGPGVGLFARLGVDESGAAPLDGLGRCLTASGVS